MNDFFSLIGSAPGVAAIAAAITAIVLKLLDKYRPTAAERMDARQRKAI